MVTKIRTIYWNEMFNDGIDHINVYSKGATELGRFLSNFAYCPILTQDGNFNSIEGYWYWLGCTHPEKDKLRNLSGYLAKKVGRELGASDWIDSDTFKEKIKYAILVKLKSNQRMFKALKECKLPLRHYYAYGSKIVEPKEGKWIIDFLEACKAL